MHWIVKDHEDGKNDHLKEKDGGALFRTSGPSWALSQFAHVSMFHGPSVSNSPYVTECRFLVLHVGIIGVSCYDYFLNRSKVAKTTIVYHMWQIYQTCVSMDSRGYQDCINVHTWAGPWNLVATMWHTLPSNKDVIPVQSVIFISI